MFRVVFASVFLPYGIFQSLDFLVGNKFGVMEVCKFVMGAPDFSPDRKFISPVRIIGRLNLLCISSNNVVSCVIS